MMREAGWLFIVVFASLALTSCASHVPLDEVPGTYAATYPFGTETITLNGDGTYFQRVVIKGQPPGTASGVWTFDAKVSQVRIQGMLIVTDGFGDLRKNWRTVPAEAAVKNVEEVWFRIVLDDNATYQYYKQ